ncbi:universal stress protein [uncultured Eudoraea sp.]|jgi:nucleotide-binding universal stress UspA family protein|uniref:universal stress protein n=1 Tax=uncultured Eudoraea sp. TaxID=1035614 RepID=UPI002635D511|nr:universal stress protein [uncultured Eudoraea sp.]
MNKILVPVDFSEHAAYALEVAAKLAKDFNSEILVLHMMGLSEAYLTKSESEEAAEAHFYMKLAKKRYETFLDKPYLKGVKVTEMVQNYKIFSEINELAKERNIDLIIMGSHGASGVSEIFVGSNTEKVVRTSDIPVLVIKKPTPSFNPELVVFACDLRVESIKAYHSARALFAEWNLKLHLVFVNLPNEEFMSTEEIRKKADLFIKVAHNGELPSNTEIIYVSDYSIEGGIFNHANEVNADLIAIPTHGRSGIAHFFKGSIGEDVVNHAKLPVITFRV